MDFKDRKIDGHSDSITESRLNPLLLCKRPTTSPGIILFVLTNKKQAKKYVVQHIPDAAMLKVYCRITDWFLSGFL